jgi:RNA 3'-terminal phosphate cyclase (ATP)
MQTVLVPLLLANGPSTLTLEGGTHNPWAPPFDFIDRVLLPIVNRLGGNVTASLDRRGFYPAGGGRFVASLQPVTRLARLELLDRGEIRERKATVLLANLPRHIAERELARTMTSLNWTDDCGSIEVINDAAGPGNVILIETRAEHATEICAGFGDLNTTAEGVAERAAKEMRRYLSAGVPVGLHLADQLMPILALGAGGSYRTLSMSRHALTNVDVIRQFADVSIEMTKETRDVVRVDVERR